MSSTYLVTGGAGFIGSNLVHHLLAREPDSKVVVYDRLTYAGNLDNLSAIANDPRYRFIQGDICDRERVRQALDETTPNVVFNLAAESHVDRSIDGPSEFVRTNVNGTFEMLEGARALLASRDVAFRKDFRFVSVPSVRKDSSPRPPSMLRTRRTRRPRRGPITSPARIFIPTACPF